MLVFLWWFNPQSFPKMLYLIKQNWNQDFSSEFIYVHLVKEKISVN